MQLSLITRFPTWLVAVLLLATCLLSPMAATAQSPTYPYQPQTPGEQLAFLYGMIYKLQLLLAGDYGYRVTPDDDGYIGVPRPGRGGAVDIETLSATDVRDDEATLRAELDLNGEDEAEVWFVYGRDDDDLDDETRVYRITDSRGDERRISVTIDDLREDTRYYYRAIAEDEDGDRSYGDVRSFRTDDEYSSGDFRLRISDTTVDEGDTVEVEWEIPRADVAANNWIGLFAEGDSNRSYIEWEYLERDTEGVIEFEMEDDGEFEFRLFLDNSYEDEIESPVIYVD